MAKQNPMLRLWALGEGEHARLGCAVLCAAVGVLGGMLPYYAAAQIILGLLRGDPGQGFYLRWGALAALGYLVRSCLYSLGLSLSHHATFSILKSIRERILEKLPRLPLGAVMDIPSGKLKQILVDQVESMETPLAHLLPEMTSNLFAPLCILIFLFVLDWRMALLSLVSLPLGMFFMSFAMVDYASRYAGSVQVNQEMNAALVEYTGGIEVIKAFNQGGRSYAKLTDKVIANASYFYHWMKSCQFPISLSKAILPTTLITVLPVGWLLYSGGSLPVETFITAVILSLGIAGPLLAAMNFVDSLARVGTIVASVDEILNAPEQDHGQTPAPIQGHGIRLEKVGFSYHEGQEILHEVDLDIPAGTLTALVGPSGGGKSTIAKLIAGFWDVSAGRITLGGQDLTAIPLPQLYEQTAFVSQDIYLFDETVRENIRMGRPGATDAQVEAAAEAAGCGGFIRALEKGYDTVVGCGGAHLSGGERQRIAIARAMLKDAPVVILDEATAYMDPENEAVIQQAVAKLIKGKTVLIIAHRLSTITGADKIVVVNGGRIEAQGTHEQLLQDCPLYQAMWRAHTGAKDGDETC